MENINAIDLGLPSGLLWADRNIGAESPEDSGLYFQWGDTQGYTKEQIVSDSDDAKFFYEFDYKFFVEGEDEFDCNMSKYNDTDGKNVLDLEDDAAHILIGGNWRMPTKKDFEELVSNTDIFVVLDNGEEVKAKILDVEIVYVSIYFEWEKRLGENFKGIKFCKINDNSVYIFVPAAGVACIGSVHHIGQCCCLFSSSVENTYCESAWNFGAATDGGGVDFAEVRYNGNQIRGVLNK